MHGSRNKTEQYRRRVYFAIYKKEIFNNLYNFFYMRRSRSTEKQYEGECTLLNKELKRSF